MARKPEQDQRQDQVPSRPVDDKAPPEQPSGDYSHGHPGVPPKDYKPPEESRR